MAVTVHLELDGRPFSLILDVVEVARSHSGVNLAEAFAQVLTDFGIDSKVGHDGVPHLVDFDTEL